MGTGVGEAMLLGAAMGGGSAALTGGDPLKGALLGGLTGGAGAGIGGALSGAGAVGTEAALTTAGAEAATNTAMAQALPASTMAANPIATTGGLPAGQSFAQASQLANTTAATNAAMNQALPITGNLGNAGISGLPAASTSPFIPTPTPVTAPAASSTFGEGMAKFAADPMASLKANPFTAASSALAGAMGSRPDPYMPEEYDGPLKRFRLSENYRPPAPYAEGGIADLGAGGYDRMVGEMPMYQQAMAKGGISDLGSYSDGGRMLRGPGDGMSDSIPASIAGKRPARLATEEFVVPADVVSHLGNGSSDAGAKQLYAMMDRVRKARTGRKSQGREINPQKYMAA
jgi:hypothetical protein